LPAEPIHADLEGARRLADAGRFEEAAKICHAHLKDKGRSAQAYFLLGLVRDAAGDPTAAEYYRKALYLEPNHYESLLHLALWSEKNGETAGARRLKSRAQRVKTKP
jgi:chemotaxis protein methyltransferase WspC